MQKVDLTLSLTSPNANLTLTPKLKILKKVKAVATEPPVDL